MNQQAGAVNELPAIVNATRQVVESVLSGLWLLLLAALTIAVLAIAWDVYWKSGGRCR